MKTRLLVACLFLLCLAMPAAADWPQWRGPDRSGVSKETGLLKEWPKKGPPLVWTFDNCGYGFSGPAVVGDRLYFMGARKDKTALIALDISGNMPKELWACPVGDMFTFEGNVWGDGPRSTPTVDGNYVYGLGGFGDLVCVDTAKGNLVWKKNLAKDFGGVMMSTWGFSESMLIDGDKLICTPGSTKGTLAALNKKTGDLIWQSKELTDKATYASVMPAEIGGVHQYVAMTYISNAKGGAVAGVDAKDGTLLWDYSFFQAHSYAVCPTPLVYGDEVYVTAGYGVGCQLLKITKADGKFAVKDQYAGKAPKALKNTHGGVVKVGDHVYGHSEKERWICQEWATGNIAWADKNNLSSRSGSICAAEGHLYLLSEEGECVLLEASPKEWSEKGRFTIPQKSTAKEKIATFQDSGIWTPPIIANGKLYLRDQEFLFCFDIRAKK